MDLRRVLIFLGFAFGIAWLTGLVIYLTGGLTDSPKIVPGISLALVLLAIPYMCAPALAHVLTRLVIRSGSPAAHIGPGITQVGGQVRIEALAHFLEHKFHQFETAQLEQALPNLARADMALLHIKAARGPFGQEIIRIANPHQFFSQLLHFGLGMGRLRLKK